jgi:type II secretory pathway component PulF
MRELAQGKLRAVSNRNANRLKFVQPMVTLLFASIVLLIAGAMIGYLSQMIHSLTKLV